MKVYRTDEIRNVVLLGHGGSGKTSLVEAMAYVSGATNRMGKVADKNTISDFDKEEQKRGFSLSTTLTPIEWEKAKINVLLMAPIISCPKRMALLNSAFLSAFPEASATSRVADSTDTATSMTAPSDAIIIPAKSSMRISRPVFWAISRSPLAQSV